jgi:hypothetical protein
MLLHILLLLTGTDDKLDTNTATLSSDKLTATRTFTTVNMQASVGQRPTEDKVLPTKIKYLPS